MPAFTAESTKRDALWNANPKIAINGFAMERDRMIMVAIFFGIWLKPTTRRFKCTQKVHLRTHLLSATSVAVRICSYWVLYLLKRRLVLFCCAESHAWAMLTQSMKLILTLQIGNHLLKTNNCKLGLSPSHRRLRFKSLESAPHNNWAGLKIYGRPIQTRRSRTSIMWFLKSSNNQFFSGIKTRSNTKKSSSLWSG